MKGAESMSISSDPVSGAGQGDWQMSSARKTSQLDAENEQSLTEMQNRREAESAYKAEKEKQIEAVKTEQQNKLIQAQSEQAAG
jgi:hypothetical protein